MTTTAPTPLPTPHRECYIPGPHPAHMFIAESRRDYNREAKCMGAPGSDGRQLDLHAAAGIVDLFRTLVLSHGATHVQAGEAIRDAVDQVAPARAGRAS